MLEALHDNPALTVVTGSPLARALDDLLDAPHAVTRTLLRVGVDPASLPAGGALMPGPGPILGSRMAMARRIARYGR